MMATPPATYTKRDPRFEIFCSGCRYGGMTHQCVHTIDVQPGGTLPGGTYHCGCKRPTCR
jgi:hypothetical protein